MKKIMFFFLCVSYNNAYGMEPGNTPLARFGAREVIPMQPAPKAENAMLDPIPELSEEDQTPFSTGSLKSDLSALGPWQAGHSESHSVPDQPVVSPAIDPIVKTMLALRKAAREEPDCITFLSLMLANTTYRPLKNVACLSKHGLMDKNGTFTDTEHFKKIVNNDILFVLLIRQATAQDTDAHFTQQIIQKLDPWQAPAPRTMVMDSLNEIEEEEPFGYYVYKPEVSEEGLVQSSPYPYTIIKAVKNPSGSLKVIAPPRFKYYCPTISDPARWEPCDGPEGELKHHDYFKLLGTICTKHIQEIEKVIEADQMSENQSPLEQLD